MILHLDDGRVVSVQSHSGKIWLHSFNGCGTINPLTPDEAAELGLTMWRAARKLKRETAAHRLLQSMPV